MKFFRHAFYFLLLGACITPFEVTNAYHESLVIQGLITDQPGPYLVEVSKTKPIHAQLDSDVGVSGASVTISDDEGNSELLVEKNSGKYYTSSIQGVIGRSYSLQVTLSDGQSFQSSPEKMTPVGDFTILEPQFILNEPPNSSRQITTTNGFSIHINSEVLPEQEGRVWWRVIGTHEILTFPELQIGACFACLLEPDPITPCSGYIQDPATRYFCKSNPNSPCYTAIKKIGPCSCCTCWVTQNNDTPLISDPRFIANGLVENQFVYFVEANVRNFHQKYYLEIQQLSISPSMYDFLKKIKIQKGNSSNLFQIPPPKPIGNITSSQVEVTGYFAVSAVKSHAVSFTKNDLPYYLPDMDTLWQKCTSAFRNSTNIKPSFW